jgi:hypothetical protein
MLRSLEGPLAPRVLASLGPEFGLSIKVTFYPVVTSPAGFRFT